MTKTPRGPDGRFVRPEPKPETRSEWIEAAFYAAGVVLVIGAVVFAAVHGGPL